MPDNQATQPRVVFGMECDQRNSFLSVTLTGDWDMDMLEGLVDFAARQRRRLALAGRGPLICDGWNL